jgi:hypothetical protein
VTGPEDNINREPGVQATVSSKINSYVSLGAIELDAFFHIAVNMQAALNYALLAHVSTIPYRA